VLTATRLLVAIFTVLSAVLSALLLLVWRIPVRGDISQALTQHPELYTLSLGHIGDLTINAFAYLKLPLALAAVAFGACALALGIYRNSVRHSVVVIAVCMIIFSQAARIALIRFDPYLGSYALAERLQQSPPGELIEANSYYAFSSVFFYANRAALLLNGRYNNLEYGSYAPGVTSVFIDDSKFVSLWNEESRWYLLAYGSEMPHLTALVGRNNLRLYVVAQSASNCLLTNHPVAGNKQDIIPPDKPEPCGSGMGTESPRSLAVAVRSSLFRTPVADF
jgi:hypothetical protein